MVQVERLQAGKLQIKGKNQRSATPKLERGRK